MLLPEDLYRYIPKKVNEWTPLDVGHWFKANGIEISPKFSFSDQQFDGISFLQTTPDYLLNSCGVGSKIIVKKILQWLEHDHEEFNEYVQERQSCIPTQKDIDTHRGGNRSQEEVSIENNKENEVKNQMPEKERHSQAVVSVQSVKKWKISKKKVSVRGNEGELIAKKIEMSVEDQNTSEVSHSSNQYIPEGAKFIQSAYEICESFLVFQYVKDQEYVRGNHRQVQVLKLKKSGRIGRKQSSSIIILHDSVSRDHAEVIKKDNQYYIRDVGSTFGTYIQTGTDTIIEEEDVFAFEDSYLQILQIKINKKSRTFDLKLKKTAYKESVINLYNKKTVTIGSTADEDVIFKDANIKANHAKIVYSPKGCLCLIRENGIIFRQLKTQQLYPLKEFKFMMRFGMQIVNMQAVRGYKPILNREYFDENQS